MNATWLGRWFIWANLDKALQGTSNGLNSAFELQDRADILIEFTGDGIQVFNITDVIYRLC